MSNASEQFEMGSNVRKFIDQIRNEKERKKVTGLGVERRRCGAVLADLGKGS